MRKAARRTYLSQGDGALPRPDHCPATRAIMSGRMCRPLIHGDKFPHESRCARRAEIAGAIPREADEATAWTIGRDPRGSITDDRDLVNNTTRRGSVLANCAIRSGVKKRHAFRPDRSERNRRGVEPALSLDAASLDNSMGRSGHTQKPFGAGSRAANSLVGGLSTRANVAKPIHRQFSHRDGARNLRESVWPGAFRKHEARLGRNTPSKRFAAHSL